VSLVGRQNCQRRSRCRTYAGSSTARIYGRHADYRIHVGRQSCRPWSGTRDYRPAASGLRVRKVRHLRRRMCRPYRRHWRRHLPAWVRQARLFPMNNYSSWKIHMKLYLTSKNLDQTIRKETRSAEELSALSATKKRKEENAIDLKTLPRQKSTTHHTIIHANTQ
jgi:hypothetical protein